MKIDDYSKIFEEMSLKDIAKKLNLREDKAEQILMNMIIEKKLNAKIKMDCIYFSKENFEEEPKSYNKIKSKKTLKDKNFIDIIIKNLGILQQNSKTILSEEDKYTKWLTNLLNKDLNEYGFIVKMHELSGTTGSNRTYPNLGGVGEVDISILAKDGELVSIGEALVLRSIDRPYTEEHLKKIFKYDTKGLPVNFMIIYAKVAKFKQLWDKYISLVDSIKFRYPLVQNFIDISEIFTNNSELKVGLTKHNRGDVRKLYHFFVNLY